MRVFHQKSAERGKDYYAASDYYEGGPEQLKGQWFGKGAALLGLSGDVDKAHFDRMVDNLHPFEDKLLTQRNHANRRVLTDITFSAPKSVSILFGVTEDYQIADAVKQAAFETFQDLEEDVQTRVNHKRGELTYRPTKNLVGGLWLHLTGRPEFDPEHGTHPDMQLHVHGAILNCTNTGGDRWTAADLSLAVRDSGYYDSLFMSRLASKIQNLGYGVERSDHNFEIAGISRETIEKFSRRSGKINELVDSGVAAKIAAQEKITLSEAKDRLGALSRKEKSSDYEMQQLPEVWRQRLTPEESERISAILAKDGVLERENITPAQAVQFSCDHNFERESVVRRRQILREAMLHGIGQATADEIKREVDSRKWISEGEGAHKLITTKEILLEEREMIAFARDGRGSVLPLAPDHTIEREWLSDEQQKAVLGLLHSPDRIQVLRGVAGVGKTTLMSEAIAGIEKAGTPVTVLAPTAEAAFDVLAKEGFEANTLAGFLVNEKAQKEAKGSVIWVDEAGLAGIQDMVKLTRIADQIDARIILSGDKRQHKSVSRGTPLRLLESEAGVVPQEVTRIRRQEGEYKDAVEFLSRGEIEEGFDRLNALGFVHQYDDDSERYAQLARDYADSIESQKSTLVIAPTHAERALVNEAIRQELKSRGHVHQEDHAIGMLKSRRLTEAQRGDASYFREGDVVEFVTKGKGGFKAGDRLHVSRVDGNRVIATSRAGIVEVPIESPKSFDIYRWEDASFAAGDTLRITKKNKAKHLYNGTLVTIKGFTPDGMLQLSNGATIDSDWGHIDHGISVTSHASQGKTFDRVLVSQGSLSFGASSPEQIYVSASRGRERVDVYTDDLVGLRHVVSKARPNRMASELDSRAVDSQKRRLVMRATELQLRAKQLVKKQLQKLQDWLQTEQQEYAR